MIKATNITASSRTLQPEIWKSPQQYYL